MSEKAVFLKWLRDRGACHEALTWAREQPDGRAIIEKCERDDWLLWLVERIKGAAWEEYERISGPAWKEYYRIEGAAWEEYKRIRVPAWEEYERIEGPAWEEYERIKGAAWAEYYRIRGAALRKVLTWERVWNAVNRKKEES